jgi:hypothetical protein
MPKIIDKRRNVGGAGIETPVIVYQHSCFADHYILLSIFNIVRFVVLDKHRANPIVKRFTDIFGCIPVSEEGKTGATRKIQEYIDAGDYSKKLVIAPEGGKRLNNDGNEVLAPFSTGAFVPLVPVQPVTIKFHYDSDELNRQWNPTWNSEDLENNHNVVRWYLQRFFAPACDITVTLMEEAFTSEGMTPKDYREDVRKKMIYEITNNSRIFKSSITQLKERPSTSPINDEKNESDSVNVLKEIIVDTTEDNIEKNDQEGQSGEIL